MVRATLESDPVRMREVSLAASQDIPVDCIPEFSRYDRTGRHHAECRSTRGLLHWDEVRSDQGAALRLAPDPEQRAMSSFRVRGDHPSALRYNGVFQRLPQRPQLGDGIGVWSDARQILHRSRFPGDHSGQLIREVLELSQIGIQAIDDRPPDGLSRRPDRNAGNEIATGDNLFYELPDLHQVALNVSAVQSWATHPPGPADETPPQSSEQPGLRVEGRLHGLLEKLVEDLALDRMAPEIVRHRGCHADTPGPVIDATQTVHEELKVG
jgi:hypothetical protein